MIRRLGGNLTLRAAADAPAESVALERDGCALLRGVLAPDLVTRVAAEIEQAFEDYRRGTFLD